VEALKHHLLGEHCWIGTTTHPVARQHSQQPCTILAVSHSGAVVMVSIGLDSGETIRGLFLYELEDKEGRSLQYSLDRFGCSRLS